MLLASYQLRRRQHSACSVLAPVTYSAAAPRCLAARYTAAFLSRRSRRRRRLTQKSVRTKRLRFAREDAPSMLCARFQPYYHSRVLGSKDDCPSRRRSLRAVDASISLYQTAFADGQQLAEVVTRPFLNRQLLRVPVRKAGHARALFRAYSGARLSRLGLRRAPQLYVDRRTVIVRSRRFVRIRRKTRAGASRLAYFHQRCLRLVRRDTPAGLLKLVSTNKLGRQACLHFTKR